MTQHAQHTPGPWKLGRKTPRLVFDLYDQCVAECDLPEDGMTREVQIANARLIAAAPVLKKALQILLQRLDQHPEALAMIGPGNADFGRAALRQAGA